MLLDLWTAHYAGQKRRGDAETEFEDDSFSVDAIEQMLAKSAGDDWEDVP